MTQYSKKNCEIYNKQNFSLLDNSKHIYHYGIEYDDKIILKSKIEDINSVLESSKVTRFYRCYPIEYKTSKIETFLEKYYKKLKDEDVPKFVKPAIQFELGDKSLSDLPEWDSKFVSTFKEWVKKQYKSDERHTDEITEQYIMHKHPSNEGISLIDDIYFWLIRTAFDVPLPE